MSPQHEIVILWDSKAPPNREEKDDQGRTPDHPKFFSEFTAGRSGAPCTSNRVGKSELVPFVS
jgi:hypothetical protein